jgi:hypothetical protein
VRHQIARPEQLSQKIHRHPFAAVRAARKAIRVQTSKPTLAPTTAQPKIAETYEALIGRIAKN